MSGYWAPRRPDLSKLRESKLSRQEPNQLARDEVLNNDDLMAVVFKSLLPGSDVGDMCSDVKNFCVQFFGACGEEQWRLACAALGLNTSDNQRRGPDHWRVTFRNWCFSLKRTLKLSKSEVEQPLPPNSPATKATEATEEIADFLARAIDQNALRVADWILMHHLHAIRGVMHPLVYPVSNKFAIKNRTMCTWIVKTLLDPTGPEWGYSAADLRNFRVRGLRLWLLQDFMSTVQLGSYEDVKFWLDMGVPAYGPMTRSFGVPPPSEYTRFTSSMPYRNPVEMAKNRLHRNGFNEQDKKIYNLLVKTKDAELAALVAANVSQ